MVAMGGAGPLHAARVARKLGGARGGGAAGVGRRLGARIPGRSGRLRRRPARGRCGSPTPTSPPSRPCSGSWRRRDGLASRKPGWHRTRNTLPGAMRGPRPNPKTADAEAPGAGVRSRGGHHPEAGGHAGSAARCTRFRCPCRWSLSSSRQPAVGDRSVHPRSTSAGTPTSTKGAEIEVLNWRVVCTGPTAEPAARLSGEGDGESPGAASPNAPQGVSPGMGAGTRRVRADVPVHDRYALSPGTVIEGPAIVEEREGDHDRPRRLHAHSWTTG